MKKFKLLRLGAYICVLLFVFVTVFSVPRTSFASIKKTSDELSTKLISDSSVENQLGIKNNTLATAYGDLNGDKYVNSIDCALMVRYILGRISEFPNNAELTSADVNGDGKVNSIDLSLVKRYVLDMINKFPVEEKFVSNKKPEDFTGTLTLAHFYNEEAVALVEAFKAAYPNVKVDLQVTADTNGAYQTLNTYILRSGSNVPDVCALEYAFVKRFVNIDNAFEDLSSSPYNAEELKSKLVPYTVDIGRDDDGSIRALSHTAAVGTFGYKRDIAKKYLGTDDPEKIGEMLSSAEKIIETAKTLKEKSGGSAKLFPAIDELLRIYLGSREHAWVEDGKLVIDPKFEEFVDTAKELRDIGMVGGMQAWTPQWSAAIQDDIHLAWAIPTWGVPWIIDVNQADDQKKKGNWGLAKVSSPYVWGGTWFGIYKEGKNKELAWEFIKFITCNSEQSVDFAKSSGDFVSNLEAIDTLSKDETMVSKTINQNPYEVFSPMLKDVNGSIMTQYDDVITNNFQDAMLVYLAGEITKDQMWERFKYGVERDLGDKID